MQRGIESALVAEDVGGDAIRGRDDRDLGPQVVCNLAVLVRADRSLGIRWPLEKPRRPTLAAVALAAVLAFRVVDRSELAVAGRRTS